MRRLSILAVGSLGLMLSLAACAQGDTDSAALGESQQAIMNGELDTAAANNAVVMLQVAGGGACTGTVFKIENNVSWILTAAHCTPARRVVVGPDASRPSARYEVATSVADQRYGDGEAVDSTLYDIAVVRVDDNVGVTPIPLPSGSDGLSVGTAVKSYGYGRTVGYEIEDGNFSRRVVDRPVAALDSTTIQYDQRDRTGICAGDSGGPVVLGSGSTRTVVGVHSNVYNLASGDACHGASNSVRVTSRLDFVNAVLNGTPLPQLSACDACARDSESVCASKMQTCRRDRNCRGLLECLQTVETLAQQEACFEDNPLGVGPLYDFLDCECTDACKTECSQDARCSDVNQCGVRFVGSGGSRFTRCVNENCCAEADAASADGQGYVCLMDPEASGCASNAKYQAFEACVASHCADVRPGSSSSSGGAEPAPEDQPEEEPEEEPQSEDTPSKKAKDEGGCSAGARDAHSAVWLTFLLLLAHRIRRKNATNTAA